MVDRNKFLGKMAEKGFKQYSLAKALNISENTLSSKINGKGYFNTNEVCEICDLLQINSYEEKVQIFLSNTSHNRDVI